MAQFPSRQAEILTLAQAVVAGLRANSALFPAPPVSAATLRANLKSFIAANDEAAAARVAAEQASATKAARLQTLVTDLKTILRYAEYTAYGDKSKLSRLGWGRRPARNTPLLPGAVRSLTIPERGNGWVVLRWKAPADGGAVASYKVERRERPDGEWTLISVAAKPGPTLDTPERGKEWEYRIIAVNRAGVGAPSKTVLGHSKTCDTETMYGD
jgi:hypothetical protein